MPLTALTATDVQAPVGDQWLITVVVTDANGVQVASAPTVTVTKPDGTASTPTVESVVSGVFRAAYTLADAGRHVARAVATGYGTKTFTAYAVAVTAATGMLTATEIATYLGDTSWSEQDLQDALDAEAAAQRAICVVPAEYPTDLREALKRRVARNLSMRRIPLAVLQGDAESGTPSVLPGNDPEIRRFEKPHLRVLIA